MIENRRFGDVTSTPMRSVGPFYSNINFLTVESAAGMIRQLGEWLISLAPGHWRTFCKGNSARRLWASLRKHVSNETRWQADTAGHHGGPRDTVSFKRLGNLQALAQDEYVFCGHSFTLLDGPNAYRSVRWVYRFVKIIR